MAYRYLVLISNIDNRLQILINGHEFYSKSVHNDPTLADVSEFTTYLQQAPFVNELRFLGYNGNFLPPHPPGNNPWHFKYRVVRQELNAVGTVINEVDIVPPVDTGVVGATPDILVLNEAYKIVEANGIFILTP